MEESQYFGSEACSALCGHKEFGNMKLTICKMEHASGFLQGGFWWEADTASPVNEQLLLWQQRKAWHFL